MPKRSAKDTPCRSGAEFKDWAVEAAVLIRLLFYSRQTGELAEPRIFVELQKHLLKIRMGLSPADHEYMAQRVKMMIDDFKSVDSTKKE